MAEFMKKVIVFFLFMLLCVHCVHVPKAYKPTDVPSDYYYDEDKFVIFKIPNGDPENIDKYRLWKNENNNNSFIKNYSEIFKSEQDNSKNENNPETKEKKSFAIRRPPIIKNKPKPKISLLAAKQGIDKKIIVSVKVSKTGIVEVAELYDILLLDEKENNVYKFESLNPWKKRNITNADKEMIYESLVAALNMELEPALSNKGPVSVTMQVPFTFIY